MSDKELAEIEKLKAEKIKIDSETTTINLSRRYQQIRALSSLGTVAAALVALASIGWNSYQYLNTQAKELRQRTEQQITSLIEQSAASEPSRRASAALGLGVYLGNASTPDATKIESSILDVLVYSLGREADPFVRDAIVASIGKSQRNIDIELQRLMGRIINDISPQFSDEFRLRVLAQSARSAKQKTELEAAYEQVRLQILTKQSSLVEIAALLFERRKKRGDKNKGIDFKNMPLKGYSFVGTVFDLRHADFTSASLWDVDFYGVDLTGADFTDAWISGTNFGSAILINATFRGSQSIGQAVDGEPLELTRFDRADLSGAIFESSCLCHADLATSVNVVSAQFERANTTGSGFSPIFQKEIASYEIANRGKYCIGGAP